MPILWTPDSTKKPQALSLACWQKRFISVEGGSPDKFEGYRFVKPPSLDKCCPGCFVLGAHIRGPCFWQFFLFWPLECTLKRGISFFFIVGVYCTCTLLLHTCYFVSGHVLETHNVGWSDGIMAQIVRASFQLLPFTRGSYLHINRVYVRFWSCHSWALVHLL